MSDNISGCFKKSQIAHNIKNEKGKKSAGVQQKSTGHSAAYTLRLCIKVVPCCQFLKARHVAWDLCKIILGVFGQKGYQQFRLKKPEGAGEKLFQATKGVNQGCSVMLPRRVILTLNKKFVMIKYKRIIMFLQRCERIFPSR